jgi:translation elongation factor EF-4
MRSLWLSINLPMKRLAECGQSDSVSFSFDENDRFISFSPEEVIPRQLFEVPIQAMVNNKVVARETISAARKDVTAPLYGGDFTRKKKLLEQQKRGKKNLKRVGKVDLPQEAFFSLLRK